MTDAYKKEARMLCAEWGRDPDEVCSDGDDKTWPLWAEVADGIRTGMIELPHPSGSEVNNGS